MTSGIRESKPDAFANLKVRMGTMNGQVKVGVLGTGSRTGGGLSNVDLAVIHEFGAPNANIPERPFIRTGISENLPAIRALIKQLTPLVIQGKMSMEMALGFIGERSKRAIQAKFGDGSHVPLQPATIKAKGSDVPLIDTGQLRQSIVYEVDLRDKK